LFPCGIAVKPLERAYECAARLGAAAVTADVIEDFIVAKRAPGGMGPGRKGLADSSIRTGLVVLGLVLKRARRRGLVSGDPLDLVDRRPTPHTDRLDPFTGAELRAILTAAKPLNPEFAVRLQLWMQTGLRAGEVSRLQRQDIDLATGLVSVRRTYSRGRLGPPETAASTRTVSCLHPTPTTRQRGSQGPQRTLSGSSRVSAG
jgi:integrase